MQPRFNLICFKQRNKNQGFLFLLCQRFVFSPLFITVKNLSKFFTRKKYSEQQISVNIFLCYSVELLIACISRPKQRFKGESIAFFNLEQNISRLFLLFSTAFLRHKLNATRLLSPKAVYTICFTIFWTM